MIDMKTETTEAVIDNQPTHGNRGVVGTATPSSTLKKLWHLSQGKGPRLSLKRFARQLVKDGLQAAKDWFEIKTGVLNATRSDKNQARVSAERSATKLARKPKKS